MDIGKSFTFMFDDEKWLMKIVVGGIIAFIPIVNFAAMGYVVELVRRVNSGNPDTLPDWDNFGQYFSDGLKLFVGLLIYSLPLLLVACVFAAIGAATGSLSDSSSSDTLGGAMAFAVIALECVMFGYELIVAILMPAIIARFAETGTIGSMLRFGDVFGFIKANMGGYIVVLLLSMVVMGIIAPLGVIACVIGVIFTGWWSYLVVGHLIGQLSRSNAMAI